MFREAVLHINLNKKRHQGNDIFMARYAGRLSDNFSTFKEWAAGVMGPQPGRTLAELLIGNYATMREWGAMTGPRSRRDD